MRFTLILLLSLFLYGCDENTYIGPTSPSTSYPPNLVITPPPGTTPTTGNRIEYRVTGNALGARVRYSNANDGLTQTVTSLPFSIAVFTNEQSLFVSLEATPTGYPLTTVFPFLSVQIFVNGSLFREASSNEIFLTTIAASGTWRR